MDINMDNDTMLQFVQCASTCRYVSIGNIHRLPLTHHLVHLTVHPRSVINGITHNNPTCLPAESTATPPPSNCPSPLPLLP